MKQLIVISDMEGASEIFDSHAKELLPGNEEWFNSGRAKLTSDVLAVCEAANEYGIDEILYYDSHFAGEAEFNTILNRLPSNVKLFDVPDRCFFWRRIRGQADWNPFGIITVGQHSRNGEENAYFAHTIQTPPIESYWINGIHIAEIGTSVLNFQGTKYIANIGCAASEKEAKELSDSVQHITIKDKSIRWEPGKKETFELIRSGVFEALKKSDNMKPITIDPPYLFKLRLCKGYEFELDRNISWKGSFTEREAFWEAPSFEIGSEILNYVRELIMKCD